MTPSPSSRTVYSQLYHVEPGTFFSVNGCDHRVLRAIDASVTSEKDIHVPSGERVAIKGAYYRNLTNGTREVRSLEPIHGPALLRAPGGCCFHIGKLDCRVQLHTIFKKGSPNTTLESFKVIPGLEGSLAKDPFIRIPRDEEAEICGPFKLKTSSGALSVMFPPQRVHGPGEVCVEQAPHNISKLFYLPPNAQVIQLGDNTRAWTTKRRTNSAGTAREEQLNMRQDSIVEINKDYFSDERRPPSCRQEPGLVSGAAILYAFPGYVFERVVRRV